MKKNLLTIAVAICASLFLINGAKAQGTLIHYWHFNNYAYNAMFTPTIFGIDADYSLMDTSKAKIIYQEVPGTSATYSTYIDTVWTKVTDYDTVNLQMSDTGGAAIRFRNPSDSMQVWFYVPTTGYKNIALAYGSQSSSITHGMLHQVFDYSVDSGMTWRTSGLSMPSDSAWLVFHRTTVTFTTDTEVNNNPRLVFRITFNGNTTGTSGNNRMDNVTLMGDAMPHTAISNVASSENAINIYPNPVENTLSLSGMNEGLKSIKIVSEVGKIVYSVTGTGTKCAINVANFTAGNYIVMVKEELTGRINTMKFMKN